MEVGKKNNGEPIFDTTNLRYSGKQIRETFDRSFDAGVEEGKRLLKEKLTKQINEKIDDLDPYDRIEAGMISGLEKALDIIDSL